MTTPATITNEMETAFHSLLEKVEEMGLCDGNYLKMTNILKKGYEASKTPDDTIMSINPLQQKFILHGRIDITIELIARISYTRSQCMTEFKVNGITHKIKTPHFTDGLVALLRSNFTESITTELFGISTKAPLRMLMKQHTNEVNVLLGDDNTGESDLTLEEAIGRLIIVR